MAVADDASSYVNSSYCIVNKTDSFEFTFRKALKKKFYVD